MRQCLPGKGPYKSQAQGDQHGAKGAAGQGDGPITIFSWTCPSCSGRRLCGSTTRPRSFSSRFLSHSGACAGCGETPYLKLLTQLFGDRLLIANATGCSSIYGGDLPTTPYTTNREGRGPAWANSLFEDNAEFGFGFRLALDAQIAAARRLVKLLAPHVGDVLATELLGADQGSEAGIAAQRERVAALRRRLCDLKKNPEALRLDTLADYLVKKSMAGRGRWMGLRHRLQQSRSRSRETGVTCNVLVLDTEVYSNTGGQQSKATPLGAAAKFAATGKPVGKKDLSLLATMYGHVYVARVAFGAKMAQTAQAFLEAERYPGPSLIVAYSHCIAHGYDMAQGPAQQKRAVNSGVWPLYQFDPVRLANGEPPLHLDYGPPKANVADYMGNKSRSRMVERAHPERYKKFIEEFAGGGATSIHSVPAVGRY